MSSTTREKLPTYLTSLVSIEFPGYLRDPNDAGGAIAALGGPAAVSSAVSAVGGGAELRLELRGGGGRSSSGIVGTGPLETRRMFFVQIKVTDGEDGERAKDGDSEVRATVAEAARIVRVVRFLNMADFQFLAKHGSNDTGLVPFVEEMARDTGYLEAEGHSIKDTASEREEKEEDEYKEVSGEASDGEIEGVGYLRPLEFARRFVSHRPPKYWFRQYSRPEDARANLRVLRRREEEAGSLRIDERFNRGKRELELPYFLKVSGDATPTGPSKEIEHFQAKAPKYLLDFLAKLFEERPVWTRRALYCYGPTNIQNQMRYALPSSAYCFYPPSPFNHTWIRYGFDPRSDPSYRQYQTVEVRVKDPVVVAAMKTVKVEDPDRYPANFTIESLPTKRILYIQLCDIRDPAINELWKEESPNKEFDPETGFFSANTLAQIVLSIKEKLVAMSREVLGADVAETIRLKSERDTALRRKHGGRVLPIQRAVGKRRVLDIATGPISQTNTEEPAAGSRNVPSLVPYVNEDAGGNSAFLDDEGAAAAAAAALRRAEQEVRNSKAKGVLQGASPGSKGKAGVFGSLGGQEGSVAADGSADIGDEEDDDEEDDESESSLEKLQIFGEDSEDYSEDDDGISCEEKDSFSDEENGREMKDDVNDNDSDYEGDMEGDEHGEKGDNDDHESDSGESDDDDHG